MHNKTKLESYDGYDTVHVIFIMLCYINIDGMKRVTRSTLLPTVSKAQVFECLTYVKFHDSMSSLSSSSDRLI